MWLRGLRSDSCWFYQCCVPRADCPRRLCVFFFAARTSKDGLLRDVPTLANLYRNDQRSGRSSQYRLVGQNGFLFEYMLIRFFCSQYVKWVLFSLSLVSEDLLSSLVVRPSNTIDGLCELVDAK